MTVGRETQRDALEAMEQMRLDLAAARSPALELYDDRREALRDLMYFHEDSDGSYVTPSRALCGGISYVECLMGIAYAAPREVWFRAAVDSRDAAEAQCVGYAIDGARLNRYVSSQWRSCGPGQRSSARVTTLVTAAQLNSVSVFSYSMRFNPVMSPTTGSDVANCTTSMASSVTDARKRAFITSVEIDLTGIATRRTAAALASLKTSASISAHAAGDYAFAAGCAS